MAEAANTSGNTIAQQGQKFDPWQGLFDLAGKGINVWGTVEASKVAGKTITNAPTGTIAIVVGAVGVCFLAYLILK